MTSILGLWHINSVSLSILYAHIHLIVIEGLVNVNCLSDVVTAKFGHDVGLASVAVQDNFLRAGV
jgi:peroxiredoxin